MRARRRASFCLVIVGTGLFVATACKSPPPSSGAAPARDSADTAELLARPLYTMDEDGIDHLLHGLAQREPDLGHRVVHLGRRNIGQPYEIFLLGEFPFELHDPDPIYCLQRSDCLTFCEHMYALALSPDWWTFLNTLQRLRYRDGTVGMLTRNHWTVAEWNRHNAFLFDDLTTELGGGRVCVPLRQIVKRAAFFRKFGLGQDLVDEPVADTYIPRERVPEILGELRDGDFVNIIRGDVQQQDAGHTGLIALGPDGTVNFLHSARPAVREQPLVDYLNGDRRCVGIKILRLRSDAESSMAAALADRPQATCISEGTLTAALAATPLWSTGAPPCWREDWKHAMKLQSYRLTTATSVDPALQGQLEEIEGRVAAALEIPPADRAFGVLDLGDFRFAAVQPDAMFYGASVPKIGILLAYFETHPEAATNLDPQAACELERMIKRSDNEMAAKYSQLVGLEQIQKILQSDRYKLYDQDTGGGLWCGKHYGVAEPRYGDPVHDHSHGATVRQCLRYYLLLEQGKLVSAAASARMKQIFAAPQLEFHNDNFVRGLNGRNVAVLRKSGLWEDWHLDTARVQHGDRVYLLAGMTHHPRGSEYLAQVAAALDELLCGSEPPAPYAHTLRHFQRAADFEPGACVHGQVPTEGGLVLTCPPEGEAVYESPVLLATAPFNEVLASWNVDVPPAAGACFEVRVGRTYDDSWSPFLHLGEWGDPPPPGERITECPLGRIDVDYFRSPEQFNRVQWRMRAAGVPGAEHTVRLARLALTLSDTTGIPSSLPRAGVGEASAEPPPTAMWQRRLDVPFRTQKTSNPDMTGKICSPTSVAMVLQYRGIDRPTEEVAWSCYDPAHKIFGNWPRNVQGAYTLGLPGYLARFSDWHAVEWMIAAGQPLVISFRVDEPGGLQGAPYKTTDGHLIVLTGFTPDGEVTVNDPAVPTPERGQLVYRRCDLENVWMRAKGGTAYVLLPKGG